MKWKGDQFTGKEFDQGFSENPLPTLASVGIDKNLAKRAGSRRMIQ
jgi:hypothetical protein